MKKPRLRRGLICLLNQYFTCFAWKNTFNPARLKKFGFIIAGLIVFGAALEAAAGEKLNEARSTVGRWVNVEQTISREAIAWQEKKTLLNDLITVAKQEIASLKKQIAETDKVTGEAESRRAELVKERDANLKNARRVATFLAGFEKRLRESHKRLPPPLQKQLESLMQRIPQDPTDTTLGIAERMQTVVGIVSQIQRFDAVPTTGEEMMPADDGTKREVLTIYLGLGASYFAAADGTMAGFGVLTESGWEWRNQPDLADAVLSAIESAKGSNRDASFANLPVQLEERSK